MTVGILFIFSLKIKRFQGIAGNSSFLRLRSGRQTNPKNDKTKLSFFLKRNSFIFATYKK